MKTIKCKYGTFNLQYQNNQYGRYYEVYDAETNEFKGELHGVCDFGWKEIAERMVEAFNVGELMF